MDLKTKNIYIIHQYGEENHFKALYDEGKKYGYLVSDQIILSKKAIINRFLHSLKGSGIKNSFLRIIKDILARKKLKRINNQVLIVGVSPFNKILNKYVDIWKKNKCFYFTSCTDWDNPNASIDEWSNKQNFIDVLSNYFKGAFCVSETTSEIFKPIFKERAVVNHSINVIEYKKKNSYETKPMKIIFIGGLIERKNVFLILDWLSRNKDIYVEFDFAGSGPLKKDVLRFSKTDSRVKVLGRLSKKDIKKKLCQYQFLILPSKEEPFGIVLLESLAAGVPCIVSNAIGPSEIILDGENGFIFSLEDEYNSFNFVMKKVINLDSFSYQMMSKKALQAAQKYDSKNIINKWVELLEKEF